MKQLFKLWLAIWMQAIAPGVYTHSVGVTYKTPEGTITNITESFTGEGEAGVDTTIAAATTDHAEGCSVDVSKIVSCCMFSALDTTAKTYAAGVLKQTFSLVAGKQMVWKSSDVAANPFTDDFDTLKITNGDGTKSTTFKARFLLTD
jgi:hypothetical protein